MLAYTTRIESQSQTFLDTSRAICQLAGGELPPKTWKRYPGRPKMIPRGPTAEAPKAFPLSPRPPRVYRGCASALYGPFPEPCSNLEKLSGELSDRKSWISGAIHSISGGTHRFQHKIITSYNKSYGFLYAYKISFINIR